MLGMMILAHLLGDYLFQFNCIARWKSRSLWGVAAHGGIVTLCTLVCALIVDPAWWPYALLIGGVHGLIDIIKARLIKAKNTRQEMVHFLLDQAAHAVVIVLVVFLSKAASWSFSMPARWGVTPAALWVTVGYLLLLQPAWVTLRMLVRGLWGADAAPHLGAGEKFQPMLERVLVATLVAIGPFYLAPMVLLPRRLTSMEVQSNGVAVWVHLTTHWAETFMGVSLAVIVGTALRFALLGR
ncbi:MAG: DUF3307 domain-containing protein [Anaerolineae bacterium]|nr:DUF3307 domain-containing protein [Anaerolineae bacterium]